jgi:hypothetical protein
MSTLPCMRPDSPRQTIIDRLEDAQAHLGAAQMQRSPNDDKIVAGHVDDARAIVLATIPKIRRMAADIEQVRKFLTDMSNAAHDPVINWYRPPWYEPAHGRPVEGPGMRGDDALPEALRRISWPFDEDEQS